MHFKCFLVFPLLLQLFLPQLNGQAFLKLIDFNPEETLSRELVYSPFNFEAEVSMIPDGYRDVLNGGTLLSIRPEKHRDLMHHRGNLVQLRVPLKSNKILTLQLKEVNLFSGETKVLRASQPDRPLRQLNARFFWGVVKDHPNSMVTISVFENEIMGFISFDGKNYTLGALDNDESKMHILYEDNELKILSDFQCHFDENEHFIDSERANFSRTADSANCVNVYVEVEKDIHDDKGSVSAASEYVLGAFSQVFILYANENINARVSEILVWDTPSPYNGPNSGDYLSQFRNELNGNYNGDIAHLVAYAASGGVAYLIQNICSNKYWNIAFSSISSSYENVPTYSWTVMVIAHEMGHNLGSRHTHNCFWNGAGNDAIDGCGPQAGYSEGCDGPIPAQGGTVMSYCHLIGGVGINLNEGFGQQPGDHMRDHVYNANCLAECPEENDAGITGVTYPAVLTCDTDIEPVVILQNFGTNQLTSVDIIYSINAGAESTYEWSGNLSPNQSEAVSLPMIAVPIGTNEFYVYTNMPNGEDDFNPSNDDFEYEFEASSADHELLLTIKLDPWPEETSWELFDENDILLFEGGNYNGLGNQTIFIPLCVDGNCFEFIIYDSYGDGIAGNSWQQGPNEGFYLLTFEPLGDTLAFGGDFGFQENTEFCLTETTYEISGFLGSPFNEALEQVEINILSNGEELQFESNGNGIYAVDLDDGSNNEFSFHRQETDLHGLSTLDLLKIQKHLVNLEYLDAPFGIIAADVNMDGKISTIDLILLQQYLLGFRDDFPHGKFWRFIPEGHVFNNPQNALTEGWPEEAEYNNLNQDFEDENWSTVRIGDVNGDYFPSGQRWVRPALELSSQIETRSSSPTSDRINQWTIVTDTDISLNGFQIELAIPEQWNTVEIQVKSTLPDFNSEKWFFDVEQSVLRVLWWSAKEILMEKTAPIFTVEFPNLENAELQNINIRIPNQQRRFATEFYGDNNTIYRPILRSIESVQMQDNQYALYQNRPNPFSEETEIPFHLPNAQQVLLEVFDNSGRLLKTTEFNGQKGMNFYLLRIDKRWSGTHYYRLSTVNWESSRKMIINH